MDINTILSKAGKWSMEGDCMLLQWMQEISQSLQTQSLQVSAALSQLNSDLNRNIINLDNASNSLSSLQHSQFVENLCQEDDGDINQTERSVMNPEVVPDVTEHLKKFFINNINVINECSEKYALEMDDSDDEDENSYIYQLKNPYNDRLLPHIYGTKLWKDCSHVGLCSENKSVEEENIEAFDESSTSQIYNANNSSTCSLSQWASSNSLPIETNKSTTNMPAFPVFDTVTAKTTAISPLEIDSPDIPDLFSHPQSNVYIKQSAESASPDTESFISRNRNVEKPEMSDHKTVLTKTNDPISVKEKLNDVNELLNNVFVTVNDPLPKIPPTKDGENTHVQISNNSEETIPSKSESSLKFTAKNLFDDEDEDDDFLNIFSKHKSPNTNPVKLLVSSNKNENEEVLNDGNLFSNKNTGPAYLKELESKLIRKYEIKKTSHHLYSGDELDEAISSQEIALPKFKISVDKEENFENVSSEQPKYTNFLSNEPRDDFEDLLPVPSVKKPEQMLKHCFDVSNEKPPAQLEPDNKSTSKNYNAFSLFSEIPPDDDFFENDKLVSNDSPKHFIESPKITKSSPNVAKLQIPEIHINVHALLPQMQHEPLELGKEKEHDYVLQNVCKNRVRVPVKRRPSTRQGRLNQYNKASVVVEKEENISLQSEPTDKIDKILKENPIEIINAPTKSFLFFDSTTENDETYSKKVNPVDLVTEEKKTPENTSQQLVKPMFDDISNKDDFDSLFLKNEIDYQNRNISRSEVHSIMTDEIPPDDFNDLFTKQHQVLKTNTSQMKLSFLDELPPEDVEDIANKNIFSQINTSQLSTRKPVEAFFADDSPPEDFDDLFFKKSNSTKTKTSPIDSSIFTNEFPTEEFADISAKSTSSKMKLTFSFETPPEDFDDLFSNNPVDERLDLNKSKLSNFGRHQEHKNTFYDSSDDLFETKTQQINESMKPVPKQIDTILNEKDIPASIIQNNLIQRIGKSFAVQNKKSLEKSLFNDSEDETLLFNKTKKNIDTRKVVKTKKTPKSLFDYESDSDDDLFGAIKSKSRGISQNVSGHDAKKSAFGEQQKITGAIGKTKSKSLFGESDEDADDLFSSTKIVEKISSLAKISATNTHSKVEKVVTKEICKDNPLSDLL